MTPKKKRVNKTVKKVVDTAFNFAKAMRPKTLKVKGRGKLKRK